MEYSHQGHSPECPSLSPEKTEAPDEGFLCVHIRYIRTPLDSQSRIEYILRRKRNMYDFIGVVLYRSICNNDELYVLTKIQNDQDPFSHAQRTSRRGGEKKMEQKNRVHCTKINAQQVAGTPHNMNPAATAAGNADHSSYAQATSAPHHRPPVPQHNSPYSPPPAS